MFAFQFRCLDYKVLMFKDGYSEACQFLDGFGFWMIHAHEDGYYPAGLIMFFDPTKPKHLILFCLFDEMPQAFFEFCRAFSGSINEGDANPFVRV